MYTYWRFVAHVKLMPHIKRLHNMISPQLHAYKQDKKTEKIHHIAPHCIIILYVHWFYWLCLFTLHVLCNCDALLLSMHVLLYFSLLSFVFIHESALSIIVIHLFTCTFCIFRLYIFMVLYLYVTYIVITTT